MIFSKIRFDKCKNSQKLNFKGAENVNLAYFETLDSQKLISRKMLLVEKLLNFHTVSFQSVIEEFHVICEWLEKVVKSSNCGHRTSLFWQIL